MNTLICYDIRDDKRRARVVTLLNSVAYRVQHSVFEANIEPSRLQKLLDDITRTVDADCDSVRAYQLRVGSLICVIGVDTSPSDVKTMIL